MNNILIEQKQAKTHMPAVWSHDMSYNRRFYEVRSRVTDMPMVTLHQAIEPTHPNSLRGPAYVQQDLEHEIWVPITAFPNHLMSSYAYLLVGKDEDDFVRVLFLPRTIKGEPTPEIKHLRVTMKQILAKSEEAASAAQARIDVPYLEELAGASGEESGEVESEEIVMSADEDECESYGSDGD